MLKVVSAVLVAAVVSRAVALPATSQRTVGRLRIQTLSPTLVRVEAQGSAGFEDRETFMVVNRSFPGVPITGTKVAADGSTHMTTAYYTVVVPKQDDFNEDDQNTQMMVPKHNSTCSNVQADVDGSPASKRIAHNPARQLPTKEACCAACDAEAECHAWVFDPANSCYLLAVLVPEKRTGAFSGGVFASPPSPPYPPGPYAMKGAVSVLALDGTVLASITQSQGLGSVSTALSFPLPSTVANTSSWMIRDGPRFVPPPLGYVPCPVANHTCPTDLYNTTGFDLRNDAADVYIFLLGAATPAEYGYRGLRAEFLALTGPVPSLPDEAFGTWFSWYHKYNQTAAEADIARWRRDELPIDIWGLDMDWRVIANGMEGKEYKVNTEDFPDMRSFYSYAHEHGLSVYMNDHPMSHVNRSDVSELDPSEAKFRYDGLTSLFDLGLDFWWYDENWGGIIPGLTFGSGEVDHLVWGQEIFRSVLAHYTAVNGPRNATKPFETVSLSMFSSQHPAEHRFPVWWTGDVVYTMLLDNVHKMVNGGLDLQPYVHPDCGAHYGVPFVEETPEMFVRWAQFCAMGTIVRFHTNDCCDHRPWTWGEEAEAAIKKILDLRYTLMPTLIAAGRRATEDGTPVVQRLDLTWPDLAEAGAAAPDQYLFADGTILVAPIIPFNGSDPVAKNASNGPGNASRTVWVPPGQWQDAWSSAVVAGPKTIQVTDCPLDQIPMWHKKGSLLLTAKPMGSTKEQSWSELSVEVFPFPLLTERNNDSDHEPMRTYEGAFYDTKANWEAPPKQALHLSQHASGGAASVRIMGGGAARSWRIRVHLPPGQRIARGGLLDGEVVNFTAVDYAPSAERSRGALIVPLTDRPSAGGGPAVVDPVAGHVFEALVIADAAQERMLSFNITD